MKKYMLLQEDTKMLGSAKLFRIRAVTELCNAAGDVIVVNGQLGGYVQAEKNLSHEGSCWLHDQSICCGKAAITGDAQIYGTSVISGRSSVSGPATVKNSVIKECAKIIGRTWVEDKHLGGNTVVR